MRWLVLLAALAVTTGCVEQAPEQAPEPTEYHEKNTHIFYYNFWNHHQAATQMAHYLAMRTEERVVHAFPVMHREGCVDIIITERAAPASMR